MTICRKCGVYMLDTNTHFYSTDNAISENEKALGFVLNLGAGGMIVGYKL